MTRPFPVDPRAPELRTKRYPHLPWRCQIMCGGQCKTGSGECAPDALSPAPAPRPDRNQPYYTPSNDDRFHSGR